MHLEITQEQARVKTKTQPVKPNHSVEMNRRNTELGVVKVIMFNSEVHLRNKTGSFKDSLCKHIFTIASTTCLSSVCQVWRPSTGEAMDRWRITWDKNTHKIQKNSSSILVPWFPFRKERKEMQTTEISTFCSLYSFWFHCTLYFTEIIP